MDNNNQPMRRSISQPVQPTTIGEKAVSDTSSLNSPLDTVVNDVKEVFENGARKSVENEKTESDKRNKFLEQFEKSFNGSMKSFVDGFQEMQGFMLSPLTTVDNAITKTLNSFGNIVQTSKVKDIPIEKKPDISIFPSQDARNQIEEILLRPEQSKFGKFLMSLFKDGGLTFKSPIDEMKKDKTGLDTGDIIKGGIFATLMTRIKSIGNWIRNLAIFKNFKLPKIPKFNLKVFSSKLLQVFGWFNIIVNFFKDGGGLSKLMEGDLLGALKSTIFTGVENFGMGLWNAVLLILENATTGAVIGGIVGNIIPGVGNVVGGLVGAVIGGLISLVDVLLNTEIGQKIIIGSKNAIKTIAGWFPWLGQEFTKLMSSLWTLFKNWFTSSFPDVVSAFENILDLFKNIWSGAESALSNPQQFLQDMMSALGDWIRKVAKNTFNMSDVQIGNIEDSMKGIVKWFDDYFITPFKKGIEAMTSLFDWFTSISGYIGSSENTLKNNVFTRVGDVFSDNEKWRSSEQYKELEQRTKIIETQIQNNNNNSNTENNTSTQNQTQIVQNYNSVPQSVFQ